MTNIKINVACSTLQLRDGFIPVRIFQDKTERDLIGDRDSLRRAQHLGNATDEDSATFAARLTRAKADELSIFSFHKGVVGNRAELQSASLSRTLVTLGGIGADNRNLTLIASGGKVIEQAKMSLASEDGDEGVAPGNTLNIFDNAHDSEAVRWAVLNCHEYTHADIVMHLLEHKIELLVVVTFNTATQLYWEYAAADVHRLFCFIVIVNVAELGGSGAFVPFRRLGNQPNATFRTAGQIFSTRGPVETTAYVELDVAELRRLRERYRDEGLAGPKEMDSTKYVPLAPSEHFMRTHDRAAGAPPVRNIRNLDLNWNSDDPLVAVVQLNSIPAKHYVSCRYRLGELDKLDDHAGEVANFERSMTHRLAVLEEQLSATSEGGEQLDFLVFPEVFVSRQFAENVIVPFCERTNAVAICGVDYPGKTDEENCNSAWVITSAGLHTSYDKITRSQYDALGRKEGERMSLKRGETLYRFINREGRAFGVLICYDFSHFDLVHRINLEGRDEPLDVLFVIAHNPFGELYRTCCVADSHRFYQHIVLCNVASYGGSGVLAPLRTEGARQSLMNAGVRNETIALTRLRLNEQRDARTKPDSTIHEEAKDRGAMMRRPGVYSRRL
ncbi:hypothetical protein CJD35_02660 [Sphingobium xenophagum]|uniref:CN hydrolase domain-containing protein n=1 Tax=Sphingobium xenophagum TaxID=121428 RepID=A0A249MQR1_SPHXE|nr:hypothetical protein [Sphingobium xenophagum]ASY43477.1 hypothetical protein CJD35_02660 [Sphingobium xenophagum]